MTDTNRKQGRKIIYIIIILSLVFISISIIIRFGYGDGGNPLFRVVSESMIPTLNVGDIVIIDRNQEKFNQLKIGDIIVFKAPGDYMPDGEPRTIIHRIVEINNDQIITTKGDNNPASFEGLDYPIKKENYIGKMVFVIPYGSNISFIISIILIGVLGVYLIKYIKERFADMK